MTDSIAIGVAYRDQAIVDGTFQGVIGDVTPAAGTFTDLTVNGNSVLGSAAADTVGFYGATPVIQRATAASHTTIATTVSISTTTGDVTSWGFSTSTQANALTAAVAEIQATLVAVGLWAA